MGLFKLDVDAESRDSCS